jgi:hypothetical protein
MKPSHIWLLVACLLFTPGASPVAGEAPADPFPVTIRVDAATPRGELKSIWRFFGADEPNYAYMRHGQKLIAELGALAPKNVYFRAHNLLTSGDGTPALKWGSTGAYREDAEGRPVYSWVLLDRIFDTYLQHGVRPYAQIGFMPEALSVKPEPYQHRWAPQAPYDEIYTGWAYPPKDYAKWAELVYRWSRHCAERYGRAEVESWYWEVWNEPNIGYWRGTPAEFHKLHDYAIDAVRRAGEGRPTHGARSIGNRPSGERKGGVTIHAPASGGVVAGARLGEVVEVICAASPASKAPPATQAGSRTPRRRPAPSSHAASPPETGGRWEQVPRGRGVAVRAPGFGPLRVPRQFRLVA